MALATQLNFSLGKNPTKPASQEPHKNILCVHSYGAQVGSLQKRAFSFQCQLNQSLQEDYNENEEGVLSFIRAYCCPGSNLNLQLRGAQAHPTHKRLKLLDQHLKPQPRSHWAEKVEGIRLDLLQLLAEPSHRRPLTPVARAKRRQLSPSAESGAMDERWKWGGPKHDPKVERSQRMEEREERFREVHPAPVSDMGRRLRITTDVLSQSQEDNLLLEPGGEKEDGRASAADISGMDVAVKGLQGSHPGSVQPCLKAASLPLEESEGSVRLAGP